jgi:hypothetical protein
MTPAIELPALTSLREPTQTTDRRDEKAQALPPAAIVLDGRRRTGREAGPGPAPWSRRRVAGVVAANAAGLALVFVGWWQSAGTTRVATELDWFNLCVGGLVVSGVANGLWLVMLRRSVTITGLAVLGAPKSPMPVDPDCSAALERGPRSLPAEQLFAVPGLSRFHRPACPLIAGKPATISSVSTHERSGRRRCEVCEP